MLRLSPSVRAKKRSAPSTPSAAQHVLVGAVAADGVAAEALGQLVERVRPQVDDGDLVTRAGEPAGQSGPDAATAHDDGAHLYLGPSWVRRRRPGLVDGFAYDEDPAGCVLEDIGDGPPDGEVATEPGAVRQAQQHHVGVDRDGLVDERGADVPGLEQLRAHLHPGSFRGPLGHVQHGRGQLTAARDLVVQVMAPIDLHDVQRDQLGVPGARAGWPAG